LYLGYVTPLDNLDSIAWVSYQHQVSYLMSGGLVVWWISCVYVKHFSVMIVGYLRPYVENLEKS